MGCGSSGSPAGRRTGRRGSVRQATARNLKIGMNDVERHLDLATIGAVDNTPVEKRNDILVNALHIAAEGACERTDAARADLLQMLDQFPALRVDDREQLRGRTEGEGRDRIGGDARASRFRRTRKNVGQEDLGNRCGSGCGRVSLRASFSRLRPENPYNTSQRSRMHKDAPYRRDGSGRPCRAHCRNRQYAGHPARRTDGIYSSARFHNGVRNLPEHDLDNRAVRQDRLRAQEKHRIHVGT